ncbi:hypothetical protein BU16DRAFT_557404 [Lophium mytilinum]|uniref:Uncharacterized protein n=1 Tax=Lophium mytilinum TaxID=390894 RepID=A0A6A6R2V9_9PEZI|nr:hypothetical protein BU16DRAFT_557404 [Lophium mytilinum]
MRETCKEIEAPLPPGSLVAKPQRIEIDTGNTSVRETCKDCGMTRKRMLKSKETPEPTDEEQTMLHADKNSKTTQTPWDSPQGRRIARPQKRPHKGLDFSWEKPQETSQRDKIDQPRTACEHSDGKRETTRQEQPGLTLATVVRDAGKNDMADTRGDSETRQKMPWTETQIHFERREHSGLTLATVVREAGKNDLDETGDISNDT